jgi:hypothetical protein
MSPATVDAEPLARDGGHGQHVRRRSVQRCPDGLGRVPGHPQHLLGPDQPRVDGQALLEQLPAGEGGVVEQAQQAQKVVGVRLDGGGGEEDELPGGIGQLTQQAAAHGFKFQLSKDVF